MSEKTVEEIAQAVCDYATVTEGAAFDLKRRIGAVFGASIKEETFSKLNGWVEAKGEKLGLYYHTSREANSNSDAYNRALNILKVNGADIKKQFHEKGWTYYYWFYQDRIFRRLKKEAPPAKQETLADKPKKKGEAVENVRMLFPKDLEEVLMFEAKGEYIVIKPRQYLGSENFAKIASIVRDAGGEYISAGKESHFRIQKPK